jgi:hypothetical protein
MKRGILSAAFAVACVAGVSAQGKPDFTGTWKPDPARSKTAGGLAAQTITVEGSRMTVTVVTAGNSRSAVYMLDGTPSKNMTNPGNELIYTSKWEGNVLVTTIPTPNLTRIEKRSIEADGSMKVETAWNWVNPPPGAGGRKTEVSLLVFNRVK